MLGLRFGKVGDEPRPEGGYQPRKTGYAGPPPCPPRPPGWNPSGPSAASVAEKMLSMMDRDKLRVSSVEFSEDGKIVSLTLSCKPKGE